MKKHTIQKIVVYVFYCDPILVTNQDLLSMPSGFYLLSMKSHLLTHGNLRHQDSLYGVSLTHSVPYNERDNFVVKEIAPA